MGNEEYKFLKQMGFFDQAKTSVCNGIGARSLTETCIDYAVQPSSLVATTVVA